MIHFTTSFFIFSLFLSYFSITIVLSSTAQLLANCDNYGTLTRSDDGGSTWTELVGESGWNSWAASLPYTLTGVSSSTVIRAACRDNGVVGGFIAEMDFDGTKYVTTNPLSAGEWEIVNSFTGSLTYIAKGSGIWGVTADAGIDSSAYWVWNRPETYNTLIFEFDFADVIDPCVEFGETNGHLCTCQHSCAYDPMYCNNAAFVADRLGIYVPGNLCGRYAECCCSCPNCQKYQAYGGPR